MGRIADAALAVLAAGPAPAERLGEALRGSGVTRARDPAAAVRRALRDDPRVVEILDGRIASLAQALEGVVLTTVVTDEDVARAALPIEPDLSPFGFLAVGATIPLPHGIAAGQRVAVRVEDAAASRLGVRAVPPPPPRPEDEAVLLAAIDDRLSRWDPERPWVAPPVTHLGTVALSVAAAAPHVFRAPGRPLTDILIAAGWEVHLGWVGAAGTAWSSLTEEEVRALEDEFAELLAAERPAEAAEAQGRLLDVLRLHLPDRVPPARRRLARALARAGRGDEAVAGLVASFGEDDPEDWYEAALIAYRLGDEVSARRWVEGGLARADRERHEEVAECLSDIGADLDGQAAYMRLRRSMVNEGAEDDGALRVARAIADLPRSYLVEAMVEEIFGRLEDETAMALLVAMAEGAGEAGREACLACSAVLPPPLSQAALDAVGRRSRSRRPAVTGLMAARPVAAFGTSLRDAPDQQQLIVTVAKERGRVAPLVVLLDFEQLAGAVKDAFFLPDMVAPRLRRELFAPMRELGLASIGLDLGETLALIDVALDRTREIGWRIPSLDTQPVLDRIDRWVLGPQAGGAGRSAA